MRRNNPQLCAKVWMKLTYPEPDAREFLPYDLISIKYKKEAKSIHAVRNQESD